ncbi:hypothetical protein [Microcoleus sp. Pol17_C1]|uniref:hypothetical protein n=1 Tax=unclassified Microcoleus TaxID=2642155 RepID=UPI002FD09755
MYTLESLQQKNLKELKEIGWQLNVLPEGDKRCRQNWIDALVDKQPPLLQLLEASPAVEPVQEAIEPVTETIPNAFDIEEFRQTHDAEIESYFQSLVEPPQEPIESKFGRIVYPHQPTELAFNDEQPPNRGDGKGRLESEPKVSQSAIVSVVKNPPGVKLSDRFLATYPPYFGDIHYQAEAETGQLNLLEPVTDEPPDPDDFETLDEFREAITLWDTQHPELIEIGLDSFCEWAPCPWEWYEPAKVMEVAPASSDHCSDHLPISSDHSDICKCWNFSIPTFDAWCDRPNRQNDTDEPPDTGIFARLPKPNPPSFPPMIVGSGDRANNIRKFARSSSYLSGRSPPSGGDFM